MTDATEVIAASSAELEFSVVDSPMARSFFASSMFACRIAGNTGIPVSVSISQQQLADETSQRVPQSRCDRRAFSTFTQNSLRKLLCCLDISCVIEKGKRLQRSVRVGSFDLTFFPTRSIKRRSRWMWDRSFSVGVQASPIKIASAGLFIGTVVSTTRQFVP